MAGKKLSRKKARECARSMVAEGDLTREAHLEVFEKMMDSRHEQDQRLAIALLGHFIEKYPHDFDRDVTLDKLIEYGDKLCRSSWNDFGAEVLYPVLENRSAPAIWIDKIADEESQDMRSAFAAALEELAKRKRNPLERILGIARYFLDEPSAEVRDGLADALKQVGKRDPERLHYFLAEHEKGAGSNRLALIAAVRRKLGWEE